jgi:hypothetical protein
MRKACIYIDNVLKELNTLQYDHLENKNHKKRGCFEVRMMGGR